MKLFLFSPVIPNNSKQILEKHREKNKDSIGIAYELLNFIYSQIIYFFTISYDIVLMNRF